MKFTITREQLQEGLGAVAAAIPAKTTLPVLANVLVEASKSGGGLRLSGTDLDIAVSTTVPAEGDADGAVTLPAKKLVDIARELPSGPGRFTAAGEARVAIECGRAKFKRVGLPREGVASFPAGKVGGALAPGAGGRSRSGACSPPTRRSRSPRATITSGSAPAARWCSRG